MRAPWIQGKKRSNVYIYLVDRAQFGYYFFWNISCVSFKTKLC